MATRRDVLKMYQGFNSSFIITNVEFQEGSVKADVDITNKENESKGKGWGLYIAQELFNRLARLQIIPRMDKCYYFEAIQGMRVINDTAEKLGKFTMEVVFSGEFLGMFDVGVKIWDDQGNEVIDYNLLHTNPVDLDPELYKEFFPDAEVPAKALELITLPIPECPPRNMPNPIVLPRNARLALSADIRTDKQVKRYIQKGYHAELGMSEQEYKNTIPMLNWNLYLLGAGFCLFLLVDPRIPGSKQYELVTGRAADLYKPIIAVPNKPYWVQFKLTKFKEESDYFNAKEPWESGLTDAEGPALRLQFPSLLKKGVLLAGAEGAPAYKDSTPADRQGAMWGFRPGSAVVASVGTRL